MKLLRYLSGDNRILAAVITCVSAVIQSERFVAMLTVAQRGQRNQAWIIHRLSRHHIDWGLRCPTAVREILRPLGLTHITFNRKKDRTRLSHNHTAH